MLYLINIFCFAFLDYLTKNIALSIVRGFDRIVVIKNFLNLTLVKNYGAAFGIMQNSKLFFIFSSLLAIVLLFFSIYRKDTSSLFLKFSYILIISGAIGNLIDRIFRGYVIDFIEFSFVNFPVFNIADIYITLGSVFLVIYTLIFSN